MVGHLTNLRRLKIEHSAFRMDACALYSLTKLTQLTLENQRLGAEGGPITIYPSLTALKVLALNDNMLQCLSTAFTVLTALTHLDVQRQTVGALLDSSNVLAHVPSEHRGMQLDQSVFDIVRMPHLRELYLGQGRLKFTELSSAYITAAEQLIKDEGRACKLQTESMHHRCGRGERYSTF